MYSGMIRQRVLLTYRVDEAWLRQQLPAGFAPTLVDGHALAGICVLRWQHLGPAALPSRVGLRVDGVAERWFAHRTAGAHVPGVVIPRRWIGGRGAATLTRLVAGGEAAPTRLAFHGHGADLRVRSVDRDVLDLTVAPRAAHGGGAVFGGDAAAVAALHATAVRGWSVCRNATVAATDLVAEGPWAPRPATVVGGVQRVLPAHAELDHVVVMQHVPARLVPVREVVAGDRHLLAAVDHDSSREPTHA